MKFAEFPFHALGRIGRGMYYWRGVGSPSTALRGGMRDPAYTDRVRDDFDWLALLSEESGWEHNSHYHPFLLRQLPERLGEALEIGCGTGEFARLLAERCKRVLALDLSPRMIEAARARSKDHPNVEYLVADAASWAFPSERFATVGFRESPYQLQLLEEAVAYRLVAPRAAG